MKKIRLAVALLLLTQPFLVLGQVPVDASVTPPSEETVITPTEEPDTVPPAVISWMVVSAEPTSVTIAWTTDEPSTGRIEYGPTTSYGSVTDSDASLATSHAKTVTGLTPNSTFHFRIIVTDEAGNTGYSDDYTFTTASEPVLADEDPPAISEITVSNINTSGATISFFADEPVQAYIQYGQTSGYGFTTPVSEEFSDTQSFAISALNSDTTYYYRIIADDEAGNRVITLENNFATEAPEPASEPEPTPKPAPALTISNIEVVSVSTSTVKITWETNKSADSHIFYGKTIAYGQSTPLDIAPKTTHSVTIAGLTPTTAYYYKVISKTSGGETASVGGKEFTTLAMPVEEEPKILPGISNVQVRAITESGATISWTTNILTRSKVEYGLTTVYGSIWRDDTFKKDHSATLSGLTAGTVYNFRVLARDEESNTTVSKNYQFTTQAAAFPPPAPAPTPTTPVLTAVKTLPTSRIGSASLPTPPTKPLIFKTEALDSQVSFFWLRDFSEKPGIQVRIIRKLGSAPKAVTDGEIIFDGNGKSFTDLNVENGIKYHYGIYAYDEYGRFSKMARIAVTPEAGEDEVVFKATPDVSAKTPIFVFEKDLKSNDKNRDIQHLQALLSQYPKIYPDGLVTGYFGPLTKQAIVRLQKRYGLAQTGYADAKTRKKLEELSKIPAVSSDQDEMASFTRDLSVGAKGEDVAALQRFLGDEGHYPEALITGYFGVLTKAALIRFQEFHSITPASGYFGPVTSAKIQLLQKASKIGF